MSCPIIHGCVIKTFTNYATWYVEPIKMVISK
jgi:hypothetical protein